MRGLLRRTTRVLVLVGAESEPDGRGLGKSAPPPLDMMRPEVDTLSALPSKLRNSTVPPSTPVRLRGKATRCAAAKRGWDFFWL